MLQPEDDQRPDWHRAFEKIGPDSVRLRLETRRNEMPPAYAKEAEHWLNEQDADAEDRYDRRYKMMRLWTIIAAVSGIIGAVTGIIALFR
jgi:hypothetical protein